ncbi:MAG: sugar phosphate isomerase/epimerase [Candidatus Gracilibacteria bacterium]|nr:sugar phosphate isomerase/epimerase [Candidatus Gracilibacteria bacterium]
MLLLSTSSLHGYGLHRIFDFAKKSGFDGIDLALNSQNHDLWDEDYIRYLSDAFHLPVLSITAPPKGMNEKKVDKIVKMAGRLKSQVLNFSPPHFSDKNNLWYSRYLVKVKRDTHLSISIQNVDPKFIFFVIPEYKNTALAEIKKLTGETTLDLASIDVSSGADILKAQKILGSSIKNIFLSDKHGSIHGVLPGGAGGGISYLPLESFFYKLKATGYNGFITLKVKPSELGAGNEDRVIQSLEFAKAYYLKHFLEYK